MRIVFTFLFLQIIVFTNAQQVHKQRFMAPLYQVSDMQSTDTDWDMQLKVVKKMPMPANDLGQKKEWLATQRKSTNSHEKNRSSVPAPAILSNFNGNISQGFPNDNHVAISDSGIVLSVVNTNLRIFNENGTFVSGKSLGSFASLGLQASTSDPRAIYDPITDRFIVLFFSGSSSTNSQIIVGFSKTNNPSGQWNIYKINGNPNNDTTWSDYPIVTITDEDLFFTFNHLKDNEDWTTGFRYSAIWQVRKAEGYSGDTLVYDYWNNINFQGKNIWSVCPVQHGFFPTGNQTYFLSVRPSDLSNDTVFLHTITNTLSSGTATFSTSILKTNEPYGVAPNALQKDGKFLATNDARVLSAVFVNNEIRYVQNCNYTPNTTAGIYVGKIENPHTTNPTISGQVLGYDTIELGYPAICAAGGAANDRRTMITCSFVTNNGYPGTAVFQQSHEGELSDMTIAKQGEGNVSFFSDSVIRWGDYNGIQPRYNQPFSCWLSGSFGKTNEDYGTWIAEVKSLDTILVNIENKVIRESAQVIVFPVPIQDRCFIEFENLKNEKVDIKIFDLEGREMIYLFSDYAKKGKLQFSFNTSSLASGNYIVKVIQLGVVLGELKIVK